MSVTVDLAEAVRAHVSSGFPEAIPATRAWVPIRKPDQLADATVTVAPRSDENAAASRGSVDFDHQIDLGLQKRLSADAAAHDTEIDALNAIAEAIENRFFQAQKLAGFPDARFIGVERPVVLVREHFLEHRVFTTLLTVTYRVARSM